MPLQDGNSVSPAVHGAPGVDIKVDSIVGRADVQVLKDFIDAVPECRGRP